MKNNSKGYGSDSKRRIASSRGFKPNQHGTAGCNNAIHNNSFNTAQRPNPSFVTRYTLHDPEQHQIPNVETTSPPNLPRTSQVRPIVRSISLKERVCLRERPSVLSLGLQARKAVRKSFTPSRSFSESNKYSSTSNAQRNFQNGDPLGFSRGRSGTSRLSETYTPMNPSLNFDHDIAQHGSSHRMLINYPASEVAPLRFPRPMAERERNWAIIYLGPVSRETVINENADVQRVNSQRAQMDHVDNIRADGDSSSTAMRQSIDSSHTQTRAQSPALPANQSIISPIDPEMDQSFVEQRGPLRVTNSEPR